MKLKKKRGKADKLLPKEEAYLNTLTSSERTPSFGKKPTAEVQGSVLPSKQKGMLKPKDDLLSNKQKAAPKPKDNALSSKQKAIPKPKDNTTSSKRKAKLKQKSNSLPEKQKPSGKTIKSVPAPVVEEPKGSKSKPEKAKAEKPKANRVQTAVKMTTRSNTASVKKNDSYLRKNQTDTVKRPMPKSIAVTEFEKRLIERSSLVLERCCANNRSLTIESLLQAWGAVPEGRPARPAITELAV